ncbi:MAG: tetratricopeptide repeat protein [Bacteroidia bacterium]|nr:tetratricopeptide repeat protein [Bacteroidia bacterium]
MSWWDDPEMVFANADVKSFDLKALFSSHYLGNYIPVTMMAHALAYFLFGANDAGHHGLSLLLHLINGVLVYQLTIRLFKKEQLALFCSAVFLLHPLQVESVAWISELKNVLSSTFYLLALLQWMKYLDHPEPKHYTYTFLFFLLGLLSKPALLVFPLVMLCIEAFMLQDFQKIKLLNKVPFLLIAGMFACLTWYAQRTDLMLNAAHEFPFWQRVLYAGYALLAYCGNFIAPLKLSLIYPYPVAGIGTYLIGCCGLVLFIFPLLWFSVKRQLRSFAVVAFVLFNFSLVLQFIPFGEVLYADRYAYVPVIGFSWVLGAGLLKFQLPQKLLFTVIAGVFALVCFARLTVWSSALSLYEDILKKFPNSSVALYSAGVESMRLDRDEKALSYFNLSVKNSPGNYKSFYNRGLLYLKLQKPNSAIQNFDRALELQEYYKTYTARATAYLQLGDVAKAMADANRSLQLQKNNPKAHYVLGSSFDRLDRLEEALAEFNKALQLDAEDAELYFKRAIVFGKQQDFKSCKNDLDVCLQLRPDYTEAYYWRGVAKINLQQNACEDLKYAAQKNFEPAVTAYNRYCR